MITYQLNLLIYIIHVTLLFLSSVSVYVILNILLTKFLHTNGNNKSDNVAFLISLINSIIMFVHAELYVYSNEFIVILMGYFVYDFLNIFTRPITKEAIVYIVHHVFTLIGLYYALMNENEEFRLIATYIIGKIELSNIISHSTSLLELFGYLHYVKTMIFMKIITLASWIYFRVILIYQSANHHILSNNMYYVTIVIYIISLLGILHFFVNFVNYIRVQNNLQNN